MQGADHFALLVGYLLVTRELLLLAGLGVALSSIDDLFIDLVYFGRRFWRWATVYGRHARLTADRLAPQGPPAPMAVFVPAWEEAAVIGAMLRDFLARSDYPNFRVFVGVYPNDPATRAAAEQVADPRLELVDVAAPGPSTKAHCLNAIWRAMLRHEAKVGRRFKAVVLHDAEDVAHSRELRVFHYLIPRLAMVQLPVAPLRDPHSRWIAGHYLDEFAENHGKELVVREALGAALPSAGVGCAFARGMLGRVADRMGGAPFDPASMTEDYELGLRIARLGGRSALVRIRGGEERGCVATREHFPATLEDALRQKTRWLLGIALLGWDRIGWSGGIADRYMLLRDRKALLSALLILIAYTAASAYAGAVALHWVFRARGLPPVVEPGSFLAWLLLATTAMLLWRLLMRILFTARQHGIGEGLRSIPRAFLGNIINFLAALRAIRRYVRIGFARERPRWEKTAHRFPHRVPAE